MFRMLLACVVLVALVGAQETKKPETKPETKPAPVLTEDQSRAIDQMFGVLAWTQTQVETKRIELASAENEQKKAQGAADDLVRKLQVEGYDLNLSTRTYTPKKKK